jgi:putative FmdB family regulatory protein
MADKDKKRERFDMPIYEYQCDVCDHRLEKLQRSGEYCPKDCPDCGESVLTKLVSATTFRLKGNGWYETDFKTGSKRNISEGSKSSKIG